MKARSAVEGPRRYEGMFLVESGLAAKDWDAVDAQLRGLVERHGGTILSAGKWDERKLAYPVKGARRATFWVCYFEATPGGLPALRRDVALSETVLRCMVLTLDKAEEVPTDVTVRRSAVALSDESEARA